jgi:3-phosphoshikimate 1-carboxyvinyltransferase
MSRLVLPARKRAAGEVTLPGSKSLSNRVLLLAALAEGPTSIHDLLDSDDVRHLRKALDKLGERLTPEGQDWTLPGGGFKSRQAHLFLGNAGTAVRPLTAILSNTPGEFVITGEPRMCERPIGPLVDALRKWGANIEYMDAEGYPPLRVRGKNLIGGPTSVDASQSSQFVSALLLVAPLLRRTSTIEVTGELVSQPYIAMTRGQMRQFGVTVEQLHSRLYQIEPQHYRSPGEVWVEGDATAASYFLAAGAVTGGPVRVHGAGKDSVQGEIAFARLLQEMGADVVWGPDWVEVSRPPERPLRGIERDLNDIPDSAMTLAMLGLFSTQPCEVRGVGNWRVKECDRQDALYSELLKLGAGVEKLEDGLRVTAPQVWRSAEIQTYNDHRMAMCFSLASLGPVEVTIANPECVSKTYPHYFEDFQRLTEGGA